MQTLNPLKNYMHIMTGSVDSGENWAAETKEFDMLREVVLVGRDWIEVAKLPIRHYSVDRGAAHVREISGTSLINAIEINFVNLFRPHAGKFKILRVTTVPRTGTTCGTKHVVDLRVEFQVARFDDYDKLGPAQVHDITILTDKIEQTEQHDHVIGAANAVHIPQTMRVI